MSATITTSDFQDAIFTFSELEMIKLEILKQSNLSQWAHVINERAIETKKNDLQRLSELKQKVYASTAGMRNKTNFERTIK